jgi:hypothetical protein
MAPSKILSGRSKSILQRNAESVHVSSGDSKAAPESNNISSPKKEFDFDDKPQKSLNEKQQVCPLFWCLFLDYFVDPSYSCYSLQLTF